MPVAAANESEVGADLPLAQAAARGDRAAAALVLERLYRRMRNLVRYLLASDREVSDLTQESMVAVLQSLPHYRGDAPLENWADVIVRRNVFASLRRRIPMSAPEQLEDLLDPAGSPQEFVERRAAVRLLDSLSAEQRHAFVLHHVLELSVPEIATELEVSPETVRSRLRLVRDKLRAAEARSAEMRGAS